MVSLDLAIVYLKEDLAADVQRLVEEMLPISRSRMSTGRPWRRSASSRKPPGARSSRSRRWEMAAWLRRGSHLRPLSHEWEKGASLPVPGSPGRGTPSRPPARASLGRDSLSRPPAQAFPGSGQAIPTLGTGIPWVGTAHPDPRHRHSLARDRSSRPRHGHSLGRGSSSRPRHNQSLGSEGASRASKSVPGTLPPGVPDRRHPRLEVTRASREAFIQQEPWALTRPARRAASLFRRHTWRAPPRCRCRRSSPRGSFRPG
jgi:hypothetical protein